MKIIKLLLICLMIASCQIHYMKSVPPAEIVVIEQPVQPPLVCPLPVPPVKPLRPNPVKPAPEKPELQKNTEDNHKKRPEKPTVKRPERPARSDTGEKVVSVYTR